MMLNKWDYNDTLINEKIKDEIIIAGFYRFVKNFFQKHKKYNSSPGRKTSGTKYFSHSPLHPGGNNRVFDTCQKYKTLQTAEMRAFLCQILFIFMLYGVVLYAIIRYEALVR